MILVVFWPKYVTDISLRPQGTISTCGKRGIGWVLGYAHFIRGRQYWKFDPVGMNSLEGYPRYIGMDFFGCRNAWVFIIGESRDFFFFFLVSFWQWRGVLCEQRRFVCSDSKGARRPPLNLFVLYSIYWFSDRLQLLLRKSKRRFLRLGASCAAILIFILHILSFEAWDLGSVRTASELFSPAVFEPDDDILVHRQNRLFVPFSSL